jgi:hypothetical protein
MKKVTGRMIVEKRKSPRKHPRQSRARRQFLLGFESVLKSADICLQKAKDESKQVNGEEEGEEEKPKKAAAPPKKAPAAEKKVAEKKAPAKKRAPKKVSLLFLSS